MHLVIKRPLITKKQRLRQERILVYESAVVSELLSYLVPIPDIIPALTNSPGTWCVRDPLSISPIAKVKIPRNALRLAPSSRITLALRMARKEMHANAKDPIQERVAGVERPCLKRAASTQISESALHSE